MAKDSGQKRSLDEIKQRIERSRYELGRDLGGLRYELDIPLKIKKSFQRKTTLWITAAVVVRFDVYGWSLYGRKKFTSTPRGNERERKRWSRRDCS